jgi:regulatory protein YycI of two-component signal transduction system YycFG
MTEDKESIKVSGQTYEKLATITGKIKAIVNQNRPRNKIPISFDQTIQLCIDIRGVNEQLEAIQIEAGL